MAQKQRLILGLGNPGRPYEGTRHNVGYEVIDRIAERCGITLKTNSRTNSIMGKGRWQGRAFVIAKPLTWMNRSGESARSFQRRMKLSGEEFLVVVDDIHLPLGALRLRQNGSAGGHNGMQNIIDALRCEDIPRLRIGIGGEFERGAQSDYVLSPFAQKEQIIVNDTLDHARDAALAFIVEGIVPAMNRFNRRTRLLETCTETASSEFKTN
ncbi:MAG: aminoacyl-tRNA hydrolase [Bacteroidetes bacterium]|nr:aminoacyl-tRNA hydrolase [Bacteroidota bacterium]MCY4204296.1 aminoacyl-tRNA hydrolase [Bacteroidota bacterium]